MANSYNGWQVVEDNATDKANKLQDFPWTTGPGVRKGGVWTIFNDFCDWFNKTIEPIVPGNSWDYSYRLYTNGDKFSCHASGTAIDLNAPKHPYATTASQSFSATQISQINNRLAVVYNGVIKWLASTDPMHFEIKGTEADVNRVAAGLVITPTLPDRWPTLYKDIQNDPAVGNKYKSLIASVQKQLVARYSYAQKIMNNGGYDGVFGPTLEAVIIEFQGRVGLKKDGVIGPLTWTAMEKEGIKPTS